MRINIKATTGITILAICVVLTMTSGIAQNDEVIINMASDMFWGVLGALLLMTLIINSTKIIRALK